MNVLQIKLVVFLTLHIEGFDITSLEDAIRYTKIWCGENNVDYNYFGNDTVKLIFDTCCSQIQF